MLGPPHPSFEPAPGARALAHRPVPFWVAQVGVWGAFAVSGAALFTLAHSVVSPAVAMLLFPAEALLGVTFTTALRAVYRRLPASTSRGGDVAKCLVVAAACVAAGAAWVAAEQPLLAALGVDGAFEALRTGPGAATARPRTAGGVRPGAVAFTATVLGIWSIAYFGQRYRRQAHREAQERLHAAALARDARLAMLRYQVNPHFLFNALTALSGLVTVDPPRARGVILELSRFLRYSLLSGEGADPHVASAIPHRLVSLGDELDAVRAYLAVEEARFGARLAVTYDVAPEVTGVPVPAFLLHPLVENAITHGQRAGTQRLCVHVAARAERDGTLAVDVGNSGRLHAGGRQRGDAPVARGSGVGLRNVRERLALTFGARAHVALAESDGWVWARLRVAGTSPAPDPPPAAPAAGWTPRPREVAAIGSDGRRVRADRR